MVYSQLSGDTSIKVDRHGLDWRAMQAGKRRCEVTKVTAVVGSGEKVATDKVRELEILVDGKRFEDEWNKPVTFSVASTLPPDTRHVKIVLDSTNGHIGTADLPREALTRFARGQRLFTDVANRLNLVLKTQVHRLVLPRLHHFISGQNVGANNLELRLAEPDRACPAQ